jgi:hypothetical protein
MAGLFLGSKTLKPKNILDVLRVPRRQSVAQRHQVSRVTWEPSEQERESARSS